MNKKKVKQLRKTFMVKPSEVLLKLREVYGDKTKHMETPNAVWRSFKKLYKEGKINNNFLVKNNGKGE